MPNTYLKVPSIDELHYRQEWMKDPKTMSYNAGYDMDLKGYDKETGTITKTDEEMITWYNNWVNKEPDKYFAYIYDSEISEPIGEVYYYLDNGIHSMGIVIQDKYRGKGYSYNALLELEKIAFEKNNISELSDIIPLDRIGAIKSFKKAGFIHTDLEEKVLVFGKESIAKQLLITKENYLYKLNNKSVKYSWVRNELPHNYEVKQVYGIVFSDDCRILLRIDNNKYKLSGGKPEINESFEETLKRFKEDYNITSFVTSKYEENKGKVNTFVKEMQSIYKDRIKNEIRKHNDINEDINFLQETDYIFRPVQENIISAYENETKTREKPRVIDFLKNKIYHLLERIENLIHLQDFLHIERKNQIEIEENKRTHNLIIKDNDYYKKQERQKDDIDLEL